ncbi:MAG: Ig-like domain-containing protein [Clostridia bacterium]|nr:Ig-like domain-containing protein [Clostridia bacterium]
MDTLTKEEVQKYRGTSYSYFRCPVDIEVIDNATGEVVAKIVNNVIDPEIAAKDNALVVFVNGDEKTVVMPSDGDYDIRITGNDDGVMDYTVSEMDGEGNEISRTNYFDVPVTDGLLMMPDVLEEYDEDGNLLSETAVIVNELGETEATAQEVSADDFGALTVDVETEGIGGVVGAGQYTVGDYVTLTAATDENNTFLGYYENGELLTKETDLSFVVKENRTLTAKFTDKTVAVTGVATDKEQKTDFDLQEDGSVVLLTATVQPANATDKRLVWSSSDETVATVTESGVVSLLAAGTVTMTVQTPDGKYKDAITLTVTDGKTETFLPGDVDGNGEVTPGDARLALRASVQLEKYEPGSAAFLAADADGNGEIESSDARTILRVSVKLESFR